MLSKTRFTMQFSTGSVGWNINAKHNATVDSEIVLCQLGGNPTVVGSKAWTDEQKRAFLDKATLQQLTLTLNPKREPSAAGNYGWTYSGKLEIQGERCQVTISLTAIGSKNWADTSTLSTVNA